MTKTASTEHYLVDQLLSTLISKDDIASTARSFLEANSGVEVCQKMLKMWERFVSTSFFPRNFTLNLPIYQSNYCL